MEPILPLSDPKKASPAFHNLPSLVSSIVLKIAEKLTQTVKKFKPSLKFR